MIGRASWRGRVVQKAAEAESRAVGGGRWFGQVANTSAEQDFLGWQSILPRWGKPWVSFVFGYKHAVPTGRREGRGLVSFYKHIVPMGRGEKRLGWFFLVNMAARRDGGCSSGAVGL